jgi:hypothetical protein
MDNLQEAFDRGFLAVKTYVDRELLDLRKRLVELEGRKPEKGDPGPVGRDGMDGKDAPPVTDQQIKLVLSEWCIDREGMRAILDALNLHFENNPPPQGEKGEPGEPAHVDMAEVIDAITPEVAKWLEDNKPKDGKDGIDGKSVEITEVVPIIEELVVNVVSEIPKPKDGVGVAGAVIDRNGSLVLTLTDGTTKELGLVVGRDGKDGEGIPGKDGKDGRDGFGFEHMSERLDDDGRTIVREYKRGDEVLTFRHTFPVVIDRGVWTEGVYQKGDGCTWGGSFWIAQTDTKAKPDTNADWRLSIRRGRDGRPGKDGKDGGPGPVGPPGPIGPRGLPA